MKKWRWVPSYVSMYGDGGRNAGTSDGDGQGKGDSYGVRDSNGEGSGLLCDYAAPSIWLKYLCQKVTP